MCVKTNIKEQTHARLLRPTENRTEILKWTKYEERKNTAPAQEYTEEGNDEQNKIQLNSRKFCTGCTKAKAKAKQNVANINTRTHNKISAILIRDEWTIFLYTNTTDYDEDNDYGD